MRINSVLPVVVDAGVKRPTEKFPTTDIKELSGVLRSSNGSGNLALLHIAEGDEIAEHLGGAL